MKRLLAALWQPLVLFWILWGWSALAEAAYSLQTEPSTAFDTTTTPVNWSMSTRYPGDDDFEVVNIGFSFEFGGVAYTQVRILSNGLLHFGADQGLYNAYVNQALPYNGADRFIAPYWDDLEPTKGGTVTWDVLGSAPNRRFVVTWSNVPHYPNSGQYSFQVVLYESGAIRFRYGGGNTDGSSATIGLEVSDTNYVQYAFDQAGSVSAANDLVFTPALPAISQAGGICGTENAIVVQFASAPGATALDPNQYTLSGGATVSSVTQQSPDTFVLNTSTLQGGQTYTLQVSGQPAVNVSFDGLMGHYFDQRDNNGNKVAWNAGGLFTGNQYYRQDAQVNFSWNYGTPSVFTQPGDGDRFSIRWNGFLVPSQSGSYEFRLYSDDGMRLTLDGSLIVNDWGLHAPRFSSRSAPQSLQAGQVYPIQVEHFEHGGRAYAQLWWRRNGGADQVVPASELKTCAVLTPAPTADAHYAFEQADFSGSGVTISEFSGNGRDGVTAGNVSTDLAGKVCKGMAVPDNRSAAVQDALDSRQDINTLAGNEGTIAFWYRSADNWSDGVDRTLVDASTAILNNANDKYFYLAKRANGSLRFALEDTADRDFRLDTAPQGFSAGTWVHLAMVWDLPSDRMTLYVNGSQVASQTFNTNGVLGNLGSLYFGDNASTYAAPGSSANGSLDEIRVYSSVLSSSQIRQVMNDTHPCAPPSGCSASFPDAVSSISGGLLTVRNSVSITSADNILQVGRISPTSNTACGGAACIADATTPVSTLAPGPFPSTSGGIDLDIPRNASGTLGAGGQSRYSTVSVRQGATLNTNAGVGGYYINQLTVEKNATLNLSPGDYYINQSTLNNDDITVNVVGSGTVRLYFNQSLSLGSSLIANSVGTGVAGNPARLVVYAYNSVRIRKDTTFSGYLYSESSIRVDKNSWVFGALTGTDAELRDNVNVIYDGASLALTDFGGLCGGCTLTGFNLSASASALTCPGNSAALTVTARCAGGVTKTDYTGTVNLTTSSAHGNWSVTTGSGTLSPSPDTDDNGAASYTFDSADAGVVTLALANSHADQLTVTVNDASAGVSATSSTITFLDNAFVIDSTDTLGYDIIAGRDHALSATLWRKDPSTGNCTIATGYNGTYSLKAWLTLDAADPGGTAPVAVAASATSLPNTLPGANNLDVAFNNGVGSLTLRTTDVGKYTLNLRDDTSGFAQDTTGYPLAIDSAATSAPWVVRPFGLHVEAVGNPAAASASGPVYTQAGANFTLNLKAVQYQAADDSDSNGVPDTGADLSDNAATASFGQEGETVTLSHSLVAPAGGNVPGLVGASPVNSFTAGAYSGSYRFDEVGIIDITASLTDGDYLGSGRNLTPASTGNVGRFVPADFSLSVTQAGSLDSVCTAAGTSYIGQAIPWANVPIVTITARNTAGTTTQNYTGAFAKLVAGDVSVSAPVADSTNALAVTASLSPGALSGSNGVFQYSFSALDTFTYDKVLAAKVAPFTADLRPEVKAVSDSDGVTGTGLPLTLTPAGSTVYWGRMKLENAYGPELLPLDVPFTIQYWDGSQYLTHTGDSCTTYDVNDATYSLTLTTALPTTASGSGTVAAGAGAITLSAPGAGNTGTVQLEWSQPDWLKDDFDGNGTLDNPSAQATFGQYRGHDRIIYWREVIQ